MGFEAPRRVYILDFADTELDGLEVKATGTTIETMLGLGDLAANAAQYMADTAETDPGKVDPAGVVAQMQAMRDLTESYASVLLEWNLTRGGVPVPADAAGLRTLDAAHLMLLIRAWQRAVSEVPAPLDEGLTSGSPSALLQLPMEETPAESLAS